MLLPAVAVLASACVTASVEQLREAPVSRGLGSDEQIVVLGRAHESEYITERDFSDCVARSLDTRQVSVYPSQAFRDALFPWFEPRTAPLNADLLPRIMADPVVAERIRGTGVRYIVWLDGLTRDGDSGGSLGCAVGPGGGGCLGFVWWEKDAAYQASLWDLEAMRSVGQVKVDASGTSYMPAFILPLPFIARTQAAACRGVVQQVRELIGDSG